MAKLNAGDTVSLVVEGTDVTFSAEDVLVETIKKDGYVSETDNGCTIVLDTNLTPELLEEGFVRELISKIQTMRKDSGFEVQDNIKIGFVGSDNIKGIFERNNEEISAQTLAKEISEGVCECAKEWNINGEKVSICIKKI